jgi:hypothetical protein
MIWRKEAICEMEVGLSPVISILGRFSSWARRS